MTLCLHFDHYKRIAELEGKLAAAEADRAQLRARLDLLENWLLQINGAPALHPVMKPPNIPGTESPTMPEFEPHRREPTEGTRVEEPSPFASARNAKDFQRIAEEMEAMAYGNVDPAMRHVR